MGYVIAAYLVVVGALAFYGWMLSRRIEEARRDLRALEGEGAARREGAKAASRGGGAE